MIIQFDPIFVKSIQEKEELARNDGDDFTVHVSGKKTQDFAAVTSYCIFNFSTVLQAIPSQIKAGNEQILQQVQELKTTVETLTGKLNEKEKVIEEQGARITSLETEIASLKEKTRENEKHGLELERYSRSFNLRLGGIKEDKNEKPITSINKAKEVIMKITGINPDIEYGHRVGDKNKNGPRTIIFKCYSRLQVFDIMQKRKDFFTSRHPIHRDLPKCDLEEKNRYAEIMQRKFEDGNKVAFTRGAWFVNGVKYVPE